jgi:hypothetical protein
MNNTTINYPFLTGLLQAELKNLAYDQTFFSLKSGEAKLDYINNLIKNADKAAKAYAAKTA